MGNLDSMKASVSTTRFAEMSLSIVELSKPPTVHGQILSPYKDRRLWWCVDFTDRKLRCGFDPRLSYLMMRVRSCEEVPTLNLVLERRAILAERTRKWNDKTYCINIRVSCPKIIVEAKG
ncbi:hypothetical protein PoB_005369900 [Plakobranchus ocellatus]|uniref:Uncharacterized protein n=1 Tax=Plakobranchus ocellatus TaxID=259542 RepID=A0AAV4C905_9GAST|nr:hypothetical protein PoB_005369900 [Plakobranchus ocellatus]